MTFVPESGYGVFKDFEDDEGFDFGDHSYEEFGIQTTSIAKTEEAEAVTNGDEAVNTPTSERKVGGGFTVGGDSPESDRSAPPPLETANKPPPTALSSSTQTRGRAKQIACRFSPNLPQKSSNPTGSKSQYGRGRGSILAGSCDPQKQSQMMEKGEELRMAISRGNVESVKSILDSGFDVKQRLSNGWPSLLHACDSAHEEIVQLLLERGADPNTHKDHYTALMAVCANKSVGKRDSLVSCARLLLNKGARVNSHDRYHMSPLLYASQNGHLSLVELLISAGADVLKQDSRNWTAVSLAASQGHLQVVQLLVSHNANPEALTYMGDSPSALALDGGHTEVADWLDSVTSKVPSLPAHPLLKSNAPTTEKSSPSLTMEPEKETSSSSSLTAVSQDSCVQYGDLELFLLSQQLGDLLPLFRVHKVQFSDLISMTEKELETMGVTQAFSRRKLLSGIAELHQRRWDMPKSSNLPYGKTISCSEATVILSHLTRHTNYIRGTLRYLDNQMQANKEIIDIHTQPKEVEKLTNELAEAITAVKSYSEDMKSLESRVREVLPEAPKPSSPTRSGSLRPGTALRVTGTVVIATVCAFCMYKLFAD